MTPQYIAAALAAPFPPEVIGWKAQTASGTRCLAVAFIDARDVMDRLDAVVGADGWEDDYLTLPDGNVRCFLTVHFPGRSVTKRDVGGESDQKDEGDKCKAAHSDALKRAAVKFGIGRYLYRLPAQWVDYDPQKKQITGTPRLPAWALPAAKEQPAQQSPHRPAPAAANGKAAALPAPRNGAELLARLVAHEAGLVQLRQCAAGELLGHVEAAGHRAGFKGAIADWACPGPALALASAAVREFDSGKRNTASTAQLEALDALLRHRGEDIEDVRAFLGIPRGSDADLTGAQAGRAALWLASLPAPANA